LINNKLIEEENFMLISQSKKVILLVILSFPLPLFASVPANFQAIFFTKVLKYARNLEARAKDPMTIGYVYNPESEASKAHYGAMFPDFKKVLEQQKLASLGFKAIEVAIPNGKSLDASISLDAIYLSPGLADAQLQSVVEAAASRKLFTYTEEESYFKKGIMLGIKLNEGRPQILVNKKVAESASVEFDARLLQVSQVIE
jgi:hypothetical protein